MQIISSWEGKILHPMAFFDQSKVFWGSNDRYAFGKVLLLLESYIFGCSLSPLLWNVNGGSCSFDHFLSLQRTYCTNHSCDRGTLSCHTEVCRERLAWCNCQNYWYASQMYVILSLSLSLSLLSGWLLFDCDFLC